MKEYLVSFMGPDGWIYQIRVTSDVKPEAYLKARWTVNQATHVDDLTFFRMEEGMLSSTGWVKYFDVSL